MSDLQERAQGRPDEITLAASELEGAVAAGCSTTPTVPALQLFRWVESHRIRLTYAHDSYLAVSLSGVRGLPHQIEAVSAACSLSLISAGNREPRVC